MSNVTITKEQLDEIVKSIANITNTLSSLKAAPDVSEHEPTPDPVVVPTPDPVDSPAFEANGIKFFKAATLAEARAGYKKVYGSNPKDTDPVNGSFYSASKNFSASDLNGVVTPVTPSNPSTPSTPSTNTTGGQVSNGVVKIDLNSGQFIGGGWVQTADGIKWTGANRFLKKNDTLDTVGIIKYTLKLPAGDYTLALEGRAATLIAGRHDLGNDVWFKMNGVFDLRKHYFNGGGQWNQTTAAEIDGSHAQNKFTISKAGTYTLEMIGRSVHAEIRGLELRSPSIKAGTDVSAPVETTTNTDGEYTSSVYKANDLISMHFDSSMDPDDLQAMIANKLILDALPKVNYIVINGTRSWENTEIIEGSTEHCKSLFPETMDAHAAWSQTVATVTSIWKQTLNGGGTVWVAEGGPADFTADVLRNIPDAQRKNVKVVQHSFGVQAFNEKKTKPSNMNFIKDLGIYITIGNGNNGGLGINLGKGGRSPKFKQENGTAFLNKAYNTKYGDQWKFALSKMYKKNLVDFSDSVELVYILGMRGTIDDFNDFADKYF